MKSFLVICLSLPFIVGCGGGSPRSLPPTGTGAKISGPVVIQAAPEYRQGAVATNVLNECTDLNTKLADFFESYAADDGITIQKAASVTKNTSGNAVVVEITQVFSGGNAFMGHRKSVSVYAELYKDGAMVDSVTFTRDSGGGAYAGFKSSCSVLGRCVKTLGRDLAVWIKRYHQ